MPNFIDEAKELVVNLNKKREEKGGSAMGVNLSGFLSI